MKKPSKHWIDYVSKEARANARKRWRSYRMSLFRTLPEKWEANRATKRMMTPAQAAAAVASVFERYGVDVPVYGEKPQRAGSCYVCQITAIVPDLPALADGTSAPRVICEITSYDRCRTTMGSGWSIGRRGSLGRGASFEAALLGIDDRARALARRERTA